LYFSDHYNKFKTYVEDNLLEPMSKNHTECLNFSLSYEPVMKLLCVYKVTAALLTALSISGSNSDMS